MLYMIFQIYSLKHLIIFLLMRTVRKWLFWKWSVLFTVRGMHKERWIQTASICMWTCGQCPYTGGERFIHELLLCFCSSVKSFSGRGAVIFISFVGIMALRQQDKIKEIQSNSLSPSWPSISRAEIGTLWCRRRVSWPWHSLFPSSLPLADDTDCS